MAIPTIYTGQNSGAAPVMQPRPPSTALRQTVTNLQQQKRQDQALERAQEKDFLSSIQSDPISIANKNVMNVQREMIEEYQNQYSNLYRERQGKLTTSDKVEMQSAKQAITAYQAQVQGDYDRYLRDVQQFNPSKHNQRIFQERQLQYLEGDGSYPAGGLLTARPATRDEYLTVIARSAQREAGEWGTTSQLVGNVQQTTTQSPWTEDKAKRSYQSNVLASDALLYRVEEDFESLSKDMKQIYLDRADQANDGDGFILPEERANAIIEYGWENDAKHLYLQGVTKERAFKEVGEDRLFNEELTREQRVVQLGKGTGVVKGTNFSAESGVPSTHLGSVDGIQFTYSDDVNKSWAIPIPSSAINKEDIPKGTKMPDGTVMVRPQVAANGMVEMSAYTGKRTPTTREDYVANMMKGTHVKMEDPETGETGYYKYDKASIVPVTAFYGDIKGMLNGYFPGIERLMKQKGYDVMLKDDNGKINLNINN